MIKPFGQRYREALADSRLPRNLLAFQRAWRVTRDGAFQAVGFAETRQRLVKAKNRVLADPAAARRAEARARVLNPRWSGPAPLPAPRGAAGP